MKRWIYGRVFRDVGIAACVLAGFFGLTGVASAAATCGFPLCEESKAILVAQGYGLCTAPGGPCTCVEGPAAMDVGVACPANSVCVVGYTQSVPHRRQLAASYQKCDCTPTGHPFANPSLGFSSDPEGSCDAGCEIGCTGTCTGVEIGGKANFAGQYGPTGDQCSMAQGDPDPAPRKPCDPLTGVCYDPSGGPPVFCANGGAGPCVPSPRSPPAAPRGPDCGTDAHSAICAGTPSNPDAPPPPPPDPPIPPAPDGNPPPPDSSGQPFVTCRGSGCAPGSSGPVTINVNSDSGPGDANCPEGSVQVGDGCQPAPTNPTNPDDGGPGTGGGGGQICPDGSQPVNGLCSAPHGECPDGSQPTNGRCPPVPGTCADGSQPDAATGRCSGGGNCSNGAEPVDGECPWTCPGGDPPVNGRCQAPWSTCPNGSPPVGGTCQPSACNPATDPNQCGQGHASGGGSCEAPPSCNGDQIACAQLFQAWSTRCAVEALSGDLDNPETGHEGEQEGDTHVVREVDGNGMLGQISDGGFFGGGSCPTLPSFSVFGHSFSFSDQPWWCDVLTVLGGIMLFMGAFFALQILME